MPKAPLITVQGFCADEPLREVDTKTWKQGHSIGCKRRGAKAMRYWQPEKERYYQLKYSSSSNIRAEVWDFCRTCRNYHKSKVDENEGSLS
jgi:hypothetical protein